MTQEGSETAIVTSALVMTGTYIYRRLTEPITEKEKRNKPTAKETAEGLIGKGNLLPTGSWVISMGTSFIVISILGSVAPSAGGYAAVLLATTSFLYNGVELEKDLKHSNNSSLKKQSEQKKEEGKQGTTGPSPTNQPVLA